MPCDGRCCAIFWWSRTPEQLAAYPLLSGGATAEESKFIADMLIPLSEEEARERIDKYGMPYTYEEATATAGRLLYTCRHWDSETRLCTAYEQRPWMCRTYPYGRGCTFGCGYELDLVALADYDRGQIEAGQSNVELGYN